MLTSSDNKALMEDMWNNKPHRKEILGKKKYRITLKTSKKVLTTEHTFDIVHHDKNKAIEELKAQYRKMYKDEIDWNKPLEWLVSSREII